MKMRHIPAHAVSVAALIAAPASAQQAATGPSTELEEVVVTGTAAGAELRKVEASFAITTLDDTAITEFAPQSTADLLRLVPGVWSESTGGVSGANVMVRGFPGGGDAPYLTVQLNGAPVYPISTLSFLENTTMFRIDETIERVEALRGGPNPVFSNGQSGLTTNFILREGGEETEGLVKYTASDYDLRRFDGYISGPLGEDFYYMVGGYITSSPGLRDAGYNSDEGNQFTINLTRVLERGKVTVFYRQTDDYGQWYLPVALNVPGVDAGYNQLGSRNRVQEIITTNSGPDFANGGDPAAPDPTIKQLDLDDGRGWNGSVTGGSVVLDITDGWTLTDRFSLTTGDANTTGLVPDGGAVQVGALLADPAVDPRAVVIGPITGAVTGRAIGADEFIQQFGAWEVLKDVDAFTNDISLTWDFERGSATFGYYASSVSSNDLWALGNSEYQVVEQGGEIVTGIACNDPAVDSCGFNYAAMPRRTRCTRRRPSTSPTRCGRTSESAMRNTRSTTRSTKAGPARSTLPRRRTCPRPRGRRPSITSSRSGWACSGASTRVTCCRSSTPIATAARRSRAATTWSRTSTSTRPASSGRRIT